jgi:predicted nucleotidyltransferase
LNHTFVRENVFFYVTAYNSGNHWIILAAENITRTDNEMENTMQLQFPLHTISDSVDADVLYALARAEAEFTVAELRAVLGRRSLEGIRRSLARLVDQGIVAQHRVGRSSSYALNRDHLAAPAIIALAELNTTLRSRITERLREWTHQPVYAAIFGSGARGEMRPQSDIDFALVREGADDDTWEQQVEDLTRDIAAWTGNDVRPLILDADTIRGRGDTESVLRDIAAEGVPLWGERADFRRLIEAR